MSTLRAEVVRKAKVKPPQGAPGEIFVRSSSCVDFETAALQIIATKKSPHTRAAYTQDLKEWFAFCALAKIDPKFPSLSNTSCYRDALVGSDNTRRRKLASLSSLYHTLCKFLDGRQQPMVNSNPFAPEILAWPRAGKVLKARRISGDQARAYVQASSGHARDHAMLCLLYDTGMRRASLASLPRANFDGRCIFTQQEGRRVQEVELSNDSISAIERWLLERRASIYMFPADTGEGPMHPNTVNKIVDRWAGKAAHPNSFRASFLRDMHEAGLSSHEIQMAAGYGSTGMIACYEGKSHGR